MLDLELAKQNLKEKNLSLVIVKEGKIIFESRSSGISGLLQAVEKSKESLFGSSVADRIVGRAAALLLVYSHVKEVYASIISKEGMKVLRENGVPVEYDGLVSKIMDRKGKDICPFERFSLAIRTPEESYEKLKTFAEKFRVEK